MALTPVQQVNLLIGNVPSNPFYPIFTDEEIQQFLDLNNQSVPLAARMAAIAASFTIAGYNTRERTGDIEVWNDYAKNYLAALQNLISNPIDSIPNGMMPYAGGISWADVCANNANPDNVRPELTKIKSCSCLDRCSCGFDTNFGVEFIIIP